MTTVEAAPLKVLLVDDAADLRLLLRMAIEKDGRFTVVEEAADGASGVEAALRTRPDLVLLDLLMPGTDGFSVIGALRDAPSHPRVVVLSGLEEGGTRARALALGADEVLSKRDPIPAVLDRLAAVAAAPPREAPRLPPRPERNGAPPVPPVRRRWLSVVGAAVVLVAGIAATVAVALLWQRDVQQEQAQSLENRAERLHAQLEDGFASYENVLLALRGTLLLTDDLDASGFGDALTALQLSERHPGMQGVAYVARVPADERAAFETRAAALTGAPYRIDAPPDRAETAAVLFAEPAEDFARTVGSDIAARPAVAAALQDAQRTGQPRLSPPITLLADAGLPEDERPIAFVLYLPVYGGVETPTSEAARLAEHRGWLAAPFRAKDLLATFAPVRPDLGVALYASAAAEPASRLAASSPESERTGGVVDRSFEVGGREWLLRYTDHAQPSLPVEQAPSTLLIIGLLLSLGLSGFVLRLGRERVAAETRADVATETLRRSEGELRFVTEHGSDILARHDLEGRYLYASMATERLLGCGPDALVGRSAIELVHDEDATGVRAFYGAVTEDPSELTYRLLGADGRWRWVETTARLVTATPSGQPEIVSTTRDVSQRLEAERALVESRERFRLTMLHAPVGVALHDLDGGWVEVNPALCRLLGRSEADLRGTTYQALTHPDDVATEESLVTQLLTGQIPAYRLDKRYLRPDGSFLWASVSSALVRQADGTPRFRLAMVEDITERRTAEEAVALARHVAEERNAELERVNTELARSNDELREFAYVASHDLSEPLRVITGFVTLLEQDLDGQLDEETLEYLGYISRGALRMQALIDDLLVYSRAGSHELRPRPVDLGEVTAEALEALSARLEETGAVVTAEGLPSVDADPSQLRQLLQNLIGNALKFVPEGETPRIAVTAHRRPAAWEVRVTDNGIGIAPEHRERVLKMFQRLHAREAYEGTGIGLAVCKKIVDRHGGGLWITDRDDGERGTVVVFTLPFREVVR
jgi:PAS domain S-box-containing protein